MDVAALIAVLIVDRPLCVHCIAAKAMAAPSAVDHRLTRMAATVNLRRLDPGRCRACGNSSPVFWIDFPAEAAART